MRFMKNMLKNGYKRMYRYISKGKGLPPHLEIINSDGERVKLTPKEYAGLYESMHLFLLRNARYPNYVDLNTLATNPLIFDHQNNAYNCCPASLSMATQLLYHFHTEEVCAEALGTSKQGTSPTQLLENSYKVGVKAVPIIRCKEAVRNSLRQGYPVIVHFQTGQCKNGDYLNDYGHYMLCWDTTSTDYVIADPSKGVNRKYPFTCLDNANKGYRENYYSIQPLIKTE